jgi:hypothetical protein
MNAQKIFAPNENGQLVELKEGSVNGKVLFIWYKPSLPRKMRDIITDPFKLYIYSEDEIEQEEFFVQQLSQLKQGVFFLPPHGNAKSNYYNKANATLSRISPSIYEFTLPATFFSPIDEVAIAEAKVKGSNLGVPVSQFVAAYRPNKKHKKEGKTEKYWFANISQLPYDAENVGEWSDEQAIQSVNQLIATGKTDEQLFASVKTQQSVVNDDIQTNGKTQYAVAQNQNENRSISNVVQGDVSSIKKEIISDVDNNIPIRDIQNDNTFALIIANENYNRVASVPFALRDGRTINEYLGKTLGIRNDHISLLEDATLNDMRYELGRLSKISEAYDGSASFIVYYIGHGIPDEKNGNGYLLPVDGYGTDIMTAYPLVDLYSLLGNMKAKKTILITDACFSGANKTGDMLVAARGIAIRSAPNKAKGRLIAFSACQGDETAYSYDEHGHGLLTYYFLKRLQETSGKTTLGELEKYIKNNVTRTAIVVNGKTQTPTVTVSPDLQEIWRKERLTE